MNDSGQQCGAYCMNAVLNLCFRHGGNPGYSSSSSSSSTAVVPTAASRDVSLELLYATRQKMFAKMQAMACQAIQDAKTKEELQKAEDLMTESLKFYDEPLPPHPKKRVVVRVDEDDDDYDNDDDDGKDERTPQKGPKELNLKKPATEQKQPSNLEAQREMREKAALMRQQLAKEKASQPSLVHPVPGSPNIVGFSNSALAQPDTSTSTTANSAQAVASNNGVS